MKNAPAPSPYRSTQLETLATIDPDLLRLKLGSVHARAGGVGMAALLSVGLLFGILQGAFVGLVGYGIAYAVLYKRAMRELAAMA